MSVTGSVHRETQAHSFGYRLQRALSSHPPDSLSTNDCFSYVGTPHITKDQLFHTLGDLPYYSEIMFPPMDWKARSAGSSR